MKKLEFKSFKEELKDINKIKGEERALDLKYVTEYVKNKEGEGKYNLLIKKLERIGFKLPNPDALEKMDWIPMKIPVFFVIASAKFFNWSHQDMIDMGKGFITFSPLLKVFIKYFVSPKKTMEASVSAWGKHYTVGKLEIVKYSEEEKEVVLRIRNFKTHPVDLIFIIGSFEKLGEIAVGFKNIKGSVIEKDNYYDLIFHWD